MEQQGEPDPGEQQQPQATPAADASQTVETHHSSKDSMEQQGEPEPGEQQQQQPQATPAVDTSQIVRPHECGVCLFVYDELDRRPRCLPCGHTYCSQCVSVLLQDGHLICPSCRTDHCAPEASHFPINYTVEAVVKVLGSQQVEEASQAKGDAPQVSPKDSQAAEVKTKRRGTAGLSRKLRSMIQEQNESIESLKTTLNEELEQLGYYYVKLGMSKTKHIKLVEELNKFVQEHQANIRQLETEGEMVHGFMEEGKEVQQELSTAQDQLEKISTAQEAFPTIDAADHTVAEAEEWLQHSREDIPDGNILMTSFMLMGATKLALKVVTKNTEEVPNQAKSGHTIGTIMEAVESVEGGPVELKDVRKNWCEAGRVFITYTYGNDLCFSSKVIWKENKIYLHSTKPGSPPLMAFTVLVSKVLRSLKYPSTTVFLDVSWMGSPQRIKIQLAADTPLTRQFVTLCLGHTGLTYRNTNFLSVEQYDMKKIVWGGDVSGQISALKQTLPPIHEIQCGKKVGIHTGMVVAKTEVSNVVKRTWFGIVMSSSQVSWIDKPSVYHIGSVNSEGLVALENVIGNARIEFVKVVDCGVMSR